jgi:hypothetical protein
MSDHCPGGHAEMLYEIVGQGECCGQTLAAARRPILWKVGSCFEGEAGIGDQVPQGHQ